MLWLCIRLPPLAPEPLARLAQWAQQWSSQVCTCTADATPGAGMASLLWLEVGGSLVLFGGHAALCELVRAELAALDYPARLGLAPTPAGARLLSADDALALDLKALRARLEPLPLTRLCLPVEVLDALGSSGLRRIGEVLALPAAGIARRFGPAASLYLRQLCGTAHEPLRCVALAPGYRAHIDFEYEIDDAGALLFPLQRLLHELQGYLRARDAAVQHLRLELTQRHAPPLRLELHVSQPTRTASELLALMRERLGVLRLPTPTCGLSLLACDFVAPRVLQGDLFTRAAEQTQQLQQVLDRLRARLGQEAIEVLVLQADHRPERAWRSTATGARTGAGAAPAATAPAPAAQPASTRPAWLYDCPRLLAAPGELLAGPERIESGWWDGGDVARDYYLARATDGARQWVYRDLRSGAWYAHGLWA